MNASTTTASDTGFRARVGLPETDPLIGSWLMAASSVTAEAMSCLPHDFLIIDMEHVPIDLLTVQHCLQAIAASPVAPIVRLPSRDPVTIKQVLDLGARTLMAPMVESAEQARELVRATRYPPEGFRGYAAMHRAGRYGTRPDYARAAARETTVIAQIETPLAVEKVREIAGVDGIDSLFIGPGDLGIMLGSPGGAEPDVGKAIEQAVADAVATGKPVGTVVGDPKAARRRLDAGCGYVAIGSDLALMMRAARANLDETKGPASGDG